MKRWSVVLVPALLGAVGLLGLSASGWASRQTAAQDATPAGEEIGVETLFSTTLDGLPPAPIPVAVARITFDPGAGLSMTANPGPALHFVEEGNAGYTLGDGGQVWQAVAEGAVPASAAATPGTEVLLGPGDGAVDQRGATSTIRNAGDTPLVVLSLSHHTVAEGGTPEA